MNTFLLSLLLVMNLPTGDIIPDFSRVGYHYGDDAIPDVRVVKTLHAPDGGADASAMIQEAIDGMDGEFLQKRSTRNSGPVASGREWSTMV